LDHTKVIFHSPKKNLSNGVWHIPIGDHLTPTLRKFVIRNQILNLIIDPSFDHNSCISYLNEQCEGTLDIYTLKPFQWDLGGSIWCSFSFSTKALNIQDSRTNATPKVGMHLGIIGFHFLHSPSFVKVCFTSEHTLLASWALELSCESNVRVYDNIIILNLKANLISSHFSFQISLHFSLFLLNLCTYL
jgi:hypothetical protein